MSLAFITHALTCRWRTAVEADYGREDICAGLDELGVACENLLYDNAFRVLGLVELPHS